MHALWDSLIPSSTRLIYLTTLELSSAAANATTKSVLLRFVLSFPSLSYLALKGLNFKGPVDENVEDVVQKSRSTTLRRLYLDVNRIYKDSGEVMAERFVSTLVGAMTTPDSLEELYVSGYRKGLNIVRACTALKVLNMAFDKIDEGERGSPSHMVHILT